MAQSRIFINYRRDDSRADSGRLYDRLASRFPGRVFRDVGSLEPGVEWHEAIARVLSQTDACIVVIGKDWETITDANGRRRLDDPRDTVRQEIVTALERKMRVFPVLVGGAKMPAEERLPSDLQALCRRNALEITEQDWDAAFDKLLKALETSFGPPKPDPIGRSSRPKWVPAAVACLGVLILLVGYAALRPAPAPIDKPTGGKPSPIESDNPAPKPSPSGGGNTGYTPSPARETPPKEAATIPEVPRRPALSAASFVGSWNAAVNSNGEILNEQVEVYGDNSFLVTMRGAVAAVGRWHYNTATESLEVTNATNFLNNAVKFSCVWGNATGDQFGGRCVDNQRNSWSSSLTRGDESLPDVNVDVPRVDLSALTLAERVAFARGLTAMRCTCPCGLNVLVCLQKDKTCPYSPNLAKNALAAFLRLTRG